jgi:hypothetical protein
MGMSVCVCVVVWIGCAVAARQHAAGATPHIPRRTVSQTRCHGVCGPARCGCGAAVFVIPVWVV